MLHLKTICDCTGRWGGATLHPSVGVLDLQKSRMDNDVALTELYCVVLTKRGPKCHCRCGLRDDDFSYAMLRCLRPGDVLDSCEESGWPDNGVLLLFHPDLLCHTALGQHFADYTFFAYRREEALHLSCRETAVVEQCLDGIKAELQRPVDQHSATILSRHIELLLDYGRRFYERQFITREACVRQTMQRLDAMLLQTIDSGSVARGQLPTIDDCAAQIGLSPAYLADMLRFKTGHSFSDYLLRVRIEAAKRMLLCPDADAAAVARQLGFADAARFAALFKRLTGLEPSRFRLLSS